MAELEVVAVHFGIQKAFLSDDRTVPVTHWFDRDGWDCDPRNAATCVCGADGIGWFAIDLVNFGPAQVH